jgi:adenosylmethionine-8-amino-7-oxononanoate aminotransferase
MSWSKRDQSILWHPYTQMKTAEPPLAIIRGKGCTLFTETGRTLLDGISSWWVNLHGHSHPEITQRVSEQLAKLEHVLFAGFTHPPAIELAERVLKTLPGNQTRVFYSDNGSTSVEIGLKMALQFWSNRGFRQKIRIVALEGGYHGDTFGAMSVSGRSAFTTPFEPYLFPVDRIPAPLKGEEHRSIEALQKLLDAGTVAVFVFEPLVQGAGGMRFLSAEALSLQIRRCQQYEVLCLADEVMTGFFRTGKFWACDSLTEKPDIFCIAKGLSGGTTPLAMTTCTDAIFEAFLSDNRSKALFHGHSFTANPVGCAAGLASLTLLESAECQARIQVLEQSQKTFCLQTREGFPMLENPRAIGTLFAAEFPETEPGYLASLGPKLYQHFLENGVLLRPLGNTVYLMPPYCVTSEELDRFYDAIRSAARQFGKSL